MSVQNKTQMGEIQVARKLDYFPPKYESTDSLHIEDVICKFRSWIYQ